MDPPKDIFAQSFIPKTKAQASTYTKTVVLETKVQLKQISFQNLDAKVHKLYLYSKNKSSSFINSKLHSQHLLNCQESYV